MPNYCGDAFLQRNAMEFLRYSVRVRMGDYAGIHASPPCQHYAGVTKWRGSADDHPDMIGPIQELLRATGLPYVIENVPDARHLLHHPFKLCGTALGLRVRRHRYFEAPWWPLPLQAPCRHRADDYSFDHGAKQPESVYRDAMGCEWMTVEESREAVPPIYTDYIGHYLMAEINARQAKAA